MLEKDAAEFTKQRDILIGEGQAKQRQLLLEADGALAIKIEAFKYGIDAVSKAWSTRPVPQYSIEGGGAGSGGSNDSANLQFMNMMNVVVAKQLGLDLDMSQKTPSKK